MLSGDGNENAGGKKSVGLITKKTTLHALFCTFLFAVVLRIQRETSKNFLITRVMEEILEGSSTATGSNSFPPLR